MALPSVQPANVGDKVQLDELMLAMDMVDTLRHQEDLVARELDHEVRDSELRIRLREIYASQGLDVSEAALDSGIRALREDRFVYRAPKPSFALRMAGLYVDRGKWARRGLVVGVLGGGGYLGADVYQDMQAGAAARTVERARTELVERVRAAEQGLADQASRHERLQREFAAIGRNAASEIATAHAALSNRANSGLAQAGEVLRLAAATRAPAVSNEVEPGAQKPAVDAFAASRSELTARADTLLDGAESDLELLGRLRGMAPRIAALRSAEGEFSPRSVARMRAVLGQLSGALVAGDAAAAERSLVEGEQLLASARQEYELRIVSGENRQSGVWRYKDQRESARNYYIVVEAVDPDGRVLELPIANEETGQTERVRAFGVRVAESVYESVKEDKLDNGLIDEPLFGAKRRGDLDIQYRRPVAGGFITQW